MLRDVDLEVEPGETVALVGATGSGKTTLVVARAAPVRPGRGAACSIDGADVREVDLDVAAARDRARVRRRVPVLGDAAREHRLRAAGRDATRRCSDAAARAGIREFVDALPDGYETRVGERGLTLSGGQRQRVAIARALLADPRILILDDATSSVDATTEARIKEALREVMEGARRS